MNGTPDLSVVIVSYQVRELLDRCLTSLASLERPSLEMWVVDNASSDGSADWVREHHPSVPLISNRENRGFSAANNQALRQAAGRYLMLLNPDTEVSRGSPNALERLVDWMEQHPRAGACGPRLLYADGKSQHSAFRFPGLAQIYMDVFPTNWRLANSRLNGRYPLALYDSGSPFQIDHPLGAAFLVRREVAHSVGYLDESFFIYVEEVDWAKRIRGAGWEIWCVPDARIIHHEARSTRQFQDTMFVELWKARFHYMRKHRSGLFRWIAARLVFAGMSLRVRQTREKCAHGEIDPAKMEREIAAYRKVGEIARSA